VRTYFPRLLGNEETKTRVGRAIESDTVPHAFLIGGPSGSGKTTLAIEMAAAINCRNKKNASFPLPCGDCDCCRRIYDGNFPDVKILSKPKDRATLGVDPVKDFREDMFLSSTEAEHKIYFIDDAECMTAEAQNALLKVLEEPPKSVSIILLAKECDRILTTIKSRAQYIAMNRFDDKELADRLLKESADARAINALDPARFMGLVVSADGRLGMAKKLIGKKAAEGVEEDRADIINLIRAIGQKSSYADIYSAVSRFPNKRADFNLALERAISALRDLLVIKYDRGARTVFFSSADEAEALCGDISAKRLVKLYDIISETHELSYRNANIPNLITSMCARLKLA
jgi:DNA polymerase III delta prime subunit